MITQRRIGMSVDSTKPIAIYVPKIGNDVYKFIYTREDALIFKPCRDYK